MAIPSTRVGMVKEFQRLPSDIQGYFLEFPRLVNEEFPWDVVIAYLHSRIELAHNMTLYCGLVKLHRVDAELANVAVSRQHITRTYFKQLFKTIFGKKLPQSVTDKLEFSEKIRDQILHGKGKECSEKDKRKAVYDSLIYADAFNAKLSVIASFKPFGPLQGFAGRGERLNKKTSNWVLKGMGFENI